MRDAALTREEMCAVIEGRGQARRVPMQVHFWVHSDKFGERQAACEALLARFPADFQVVEAPMPNVFNAPDDDPSFRWMNIADPYAGSTVPEEDRAALRDWAELDGVLADFPSPYYPGLITDNPVADGRYRNGHWWFWLFERHWSLRKMTNALTDYYEYPEEVHRLFRKLTDFYLVVIERLRREGGCDGIFTSDDLGHQTGPFFSPEMFREFFKPYYRELVERTHELGMHFWLHSCGCIEKFIPDLVDIGVDVLHPIQRHTMDEARIAREYGPKLCIWAGLDVQQAIPWGTPAQVRQEVRWLLDTFYRSEGRLILTAGNGINGDCTLESLEAFLDEGLVYGQQLCQRG
jgi:hypothetical protein